MAEGARQLSPVNDGRKRGGIAAIAFLLLVAGSALAATLFVGLQSGSQASLDGLAKPAIFTLWQALLSTALSLALAIPVTVALESLPGKNARSAILSVFAIPLSLPAIVAVLAILTLLGRSGWLADFLQTLGIGRRPDVYGLSGILIAHVFFNMPLAVRLFSSALDGIAEEQWKLAASLRFTFTGRFQVLLWPVLKSALPGIAGLVFMLCFASYTIILVIGGGPSSATLQTAIQQALTFDLDVARAAWLTLLQLGLTLALVLALPQSAAVESSFNSIGTRRWHRTSRAETVAAHALSIAAALLVALPLVAVVLSGMSGDHLRILSEASLWRAVSTSALIGTVSALAAVVLGWCLASARHAFGSGSASVFAALVERVPIALLGLPPLVLGTGWFLLAMQFGAVTTVAPLAIIAANALMALPFVLQIMAPALSAHYAATDRLAASLRLGGWNRLHIVDVPAVKRPVMQSLLLAFALSLGDLGVVTLFGSDQIQTFPALIYAKMGAYRTNDAAVLALYLAVITGFLAWLALKERRND